ncbi:unnamed protein product [Pedinophyceae sp. YPF-701]|nr:unnamed protein product [Pedinophyceae sp. YPF-701]
MIGYHKYGFKYSSWLTKRAWWGLTNLRALCMRDVDLTDGEVAGAMADLLRTTQVLERVDLAADWIGGAGSGAAPCVRKILLALADNTSMRQFRLSVHNEECLLGADIGDAVAVVVRDNRTLRELELDLQIWHDAAYDLEHNEAIEFPSVEAVARALSTNTTLEKLRLPGLGTKCDVPTAGAMIARNTNLRHLGFYQLALTATDMWCLGSGLAGMSSLQSLEVWSVATHPNDEVPTGITGVLRDVLSVGAHKSPLRRLSLRLCLLDGDEASTLADLLASKRHMLQELELVQNNIGDEGAEHLARALRTNTTLVSLRVEDRSMSCVGVLALLRALQRNAALRVLDFGGTVEVTPDIQAELQHVHWRVRI